VWYAFDITDINEKGENKYSMPGLVWSLVTLKGIYTIIELSLSSLSHLLCSVVASLMRQRVSSALHQDFDLCSWKLPLPRPLGGGRIRRSLLEDYSWLQISCCERSCAHLTGAVKSNSSGIEVWSGSLVLTGSRSSDALIVEQLNIESTSTWIRGDR
jgi:hypothetical protein